MKLFLNKESFEQIVLLNLQSEEIISQKIYELDFVTMEAKKVNLSLVNNKIEFKYN